MKTKSTGLEGVTVTTKEGTIGVKEYVQGKESVEAEKFFNQEASVIIPRHIKEKYRDKPGRRITMEKVYNKHEISYVNAFKNQISSDSRIFKTITELGTFSPADVCDLLPDISKGTVSATVSIIYSILSKMDLMSREETAPLRFKYILKANATANPLETFILYKTELRKTRKEQKLAYTTPEPVTIPEPESTPEPAVTPEAPATSSTLETLVRLLEKGIKIKFEIEIKV